MKEGKLANWQIRDEVCRTYPQVGRGIIEHWASRIRIFGSLEAYQKHSLERKRASVAGKPKAVTEQSVNLPPQQVEDAVFEMIKRGRDVPALQQSLEALTVANKQLQSEIEKLHNENRGLRKSMESSLSSRLAAMNQKADKLI